MPGTTRRRVSGLRGVTMPCSIISVKGRYGARPSSRVLWPTRTRSPRASASVSISWVSRVLPTPASPETSTSEPCPRRASSTARRRSARSRSRPTNGVWRTGPAVPPASRPHSTTYSRQRSGNPRSQYSPRSTNENVPVASTASRTAAVTRIWPPTASDMTREAAWTSWP
jgi:hypothetical protein